MAVIDEPVVDLCTIATPGYQALSFSTGSIPLDRVLDAEKENFDYLPIIGELGDPIGVCPVSRLKAIAILGQSLTNADPAIVPQLLPRRVAITNLIDTLATTPAAIVIEDDVVGYSIVTMSDLNRPPLRGYLYLPTALLENMLAESLEYLYGDLETSEWLDLVPERNQVGVLGRWELDKLRDIETGRFVGCTLSDLRVIVGKSPKLVSQIGLSKSILNDQLQKIVDLRNIVMHPVKPFVGANDRPEQIVAKIKDLIDLGNRVAAARAAILVQ